MNWAESSFSYCWCWTCWRTNLGFYLSDLSGKHCPHLASVMSAVSVCQMIHDNDNHITALLLTSPLLSSPPTTPTRTMYYCTANLTPRSSCRKQMEKKQFICRGVKSGRKTISCWLSGQMWGQILTSQFINFPHFYVEEKQRLSVIIKHKLSSSGVC